MSLTSFLRDCPEIREALSEAFPCPLREIDAKLQARPMSTNYAIVGQAFDYLMRWNMYRNNPYCAKDRITWLADFLDDEENTPELLFRRIKIGPYEEATEVIEPEETYELLNQARRNLHTAHAVFQDYLGHGWVSRDVAAACLELAKIDGIFRAYEIRDEIGVQSLQDITDLQYLHTVIPHHPFHTEQPVSLNPALPFPSGADCDLFVGESLIEIKTTKYGTIKDDYWHQLLGYYLTTLKGNTTGIPILPGPTAIHLGYLGNYPIRALGIYFSRHGYLWQCPLEEVARVEQFLDFLPTWQKWVTHYHTKRSQ